MAGTRVPLSSHIMAATFIAKRILTCLHEHRKNPAPPPPHLFPMPIRKVRPSFECQPRNTPIAGEKLSVKWPPRLEQHAMPCILALRLCGNYCRMCRDGLAWRLSDDQIRAAKLHLIRCAPGRPFVNGGLVRRGITNLRPLGSHSRFFWRASRHR